MAKPDGRKMSRRDMVLINEGDRIPAKRGNIKVGLRKGGMPNCDAAKQDSIGQYGWMATQAGFITCRRGEVLEVQDALISTP